MATTTAAKAKTTIMPGEPRPDIEVVGDALKARTGGREASLSLRVPMSVLDGLWTIDDEPGDTMVKYGRLLDLMPDETAEAVRSLDDDATMQVAVAFRWSAAIGERLGKLRLGLPTGSTE